MISIYYDVENLGNCDITFVIEQLVRNLGTTNKFQHYAYYDWILSPEMKSQYELLGIDCVSIRESYTSSKFKNQADIKISIDIIKNSYEKGEKYVVIVTGDNHFTTVVNTLKDRGIKVCIASGNNNCGKRLLESADLYIPLEAKRPKGLENGAYLALLKMFEESLDRSNAYSLLTSILDTLCCSYLCNLFKNDGIQLSTLISLIRHYMNLNTNSLGYRKPSDFARAATAYTNYCVAYQGYDSKVVKLFKRGYVKENYIEMSGLPVVNVNSKDYYCQISNFPDDFSVGKMVSILKRIKTNYSDLPEIMEYAELMKNIGILEIDGKEIKIVRRNYYRCAVRKYVTLKVQEQGISVNDSILSEFT